MYGPTLQDLAHQLQVERRARRTQTLLFLGALMLVVFALGPRDGRGLAEPTPAAAPAPPAASPRAVTPRADLSALEQSQIEVFGRSAGSVVAVTNIGAQRDPWSRRVLRVKQGSGSGFVWDAQGHIVTNLHVVNKARQLEVVTSSGAVLPAAVVGVYPDKDIAVLRVEPGDETLPALRLGTSGDLQVGQAVYAIGNPFGLDQTMTAGMVSALGREIESGYGTSTYGEGRTIEDVIQTDAAINPGNSGGPLLDSAGRAIGMNTQIATGGAEQSAGIGFAIPIDTIRRVVRQLIEVGEVRRPQLGVVLLPDAWARRNGIEGVAIRSVGEGSGAAAAGLEGVSRKGRRAVLGDVIVAVQGKPIAALDDLLNEMERHEPGDTVAVTVLRRGERVEVPVVLGSSAGR